jgi:hypothetical protein
VGRCDIPNEATDAANEEPENEAAAKANSPLEFVRRVQALRRLTLLVTGLPKAGPVDQRVRPHSYLAKHMLFLCLSIDSITSKFLSRK